MRLAAATAVLALALLPPTASPAQTPIQLGQGDQPNVTLDASGAAHIVFRGAGADSPRLTYCRIPRGGTGCAQRTEIATSGDSLSLPIAIPNGNVIQVVNYRYGLSGPNFPNYDNTVLFTSTDNGASFDGGVVVGRVGMADAAIGPGNGLSATTDTGPCGTCFQRVPLDGGNAGNTPAVLSTTHPYVSTIGFVDPNTPLVVYADGNGNQQFRRYTGSGDINDAANWTPPVDIGSGDYPILASGPIGLFMLTQGQFSGRTAVARRFDGSTFGAPVQVSDGVRFDDMVQDGAGRMHAVAPAYDPGPTGNAMRYVSSDDGVTWHTANIVWPTRMGRMKLAVAGDHLGFVVGTMGSNAVFAAPIGPTAEQPRLGLSARASVVSGTVLIRRPGAGGFTRLAGTDVIPVGSIVDTVRGRVAISTTLPSGALQTAEFFQGAFRLAQDRTGLTTLSLVGTTRGARAGAATTRVIRRLWGDGKGKFRTRGKYATASLRGTRWLTADQANGTLVRVTQGSVVVRDLRRRRNIVLRAGRSYLARP